MRNSCAVSLTRAKFDCSRSKRKTERIICVASESSSIRADSLPPFRFRFHIVCGRWWRYEGSVIAIINRAGVQRCRSASRAIVSREQWRDRSHPRRRSIFIESSPAPPSLFPLTARFYRRYSTWCGKRFGTRLLQRAKGGFGRRWRLAARKHFALPVGSAGDASIKIANSANGFRRFHSFRSRPSIAPLCRFDTLRRR